MQFVKNSQASAVFGFSIVGFALPLYLLLLSGFPTVDALKVCAMIFVQIVCGALIWAQVMHPRQVDIVEGVGMGLALGSILAVIGHQQEAGGVLVQAPHGLQAALAQGRGQQVVHAGPGPGLERAFVAGRLVQHDVGLGAEVPLFVAYREGDPRRTIAAAGVEFCIGVFTRLAGDADVTGADEGAAFLAAAEALGVEEAFELHGAHVIAGEGASG